MIVTTDGDNILNEFRMRNKHGETWADHIRLLFNNTYYGDENVNYAYLIHSLGLIPIVFGLFCSDNVHLLSTSPSNQVPKTKAIISSNELTVYLYRWILQ